MLPRIQLADSQTLPLAAKHDTLWVQNGLHDICAQPGEFAMLFSNVRPSLIRESNRHTTLGNNPIDHCLLIGRS
jgi:hypothetical protein